MIVTHDKTSARARRRGAAVERPLCAALAVVSMLLLTTIAVSDSEHVDSGWAVSKPVNPDVVLQHEQPADPKLRIAINHVLEQGRMPLLVAPSQSAAAAAAAAAAKPAAPPEETAEVGDHNVSIDGWRPAHIPRAANTEDTAPQTESPVAAPIAKETSPADDEPAPPTAEILSVTPTEPTGMPLPAEDPPADDDDAPPADDNFTMTEDADAEPAETVDEVPDEAQEEVVVEVEPPATAPPKSPPKSAKQLIIEMATPLPKGDPETTVEVTDNPNSLASAIGPPPEGDAQPAPLTKQLEGLRNKLRRVVKSYFNKPLNSRDNDPWENMHGMLAYGIHSRIRQGGSSGKLITSVGWLCYNKPCKGLTLLYSTKEGELRAKYGVGLQGHMGQFLAMLAQCHVAPDYPIKVGKNNYTVNDLIEAEKVTCYSKSELTFKLIGLMHYCESDTKWVNDQGAQWDIPKLIREELAQPIRGAACGGTHRLSSLSLAARTRVRRGEPLDGEYLRAAEFVEKYHNYAFQMQNRDGSLSTQWFRGRGSDPDIDRRVKTTGHILEWLCYSLDDEQLRDSRTISAVSYLTNLLYSNFDHEWEVGPMCHALHALRLYDERVFQPLDGQQEIVSGPSKRSTANRNQNSSSRTQQR